MTTGRLRPFSRTAPPQVVLLGSAPDPKVQSDFERMADELKTSHWDSAAMVFKFDEPLSHLVYAGSDFLLVPSIFEPCGLSQLIAMRYGAPAGDGWNMAWSGASCVE